MVWDLWAALRPKQGVCILHVCHQKGLESHGFNGVQVVGVKLIHEFTLKKSSQ